MVSLIKIISIRTDTRFFIMAARGDYQYGIGGRIAKVL